jgi:heptosyltransferase II
MNILILALSGIGDALMFSPALHLLRKKFPKAQIDLLSMFKGVEELYTRNSNVNTVYYWNFLSANLFSSLSFLCKLRRQHYDVSINVYPSNRWPYNIISFLVGARKRIGHDYNHVNVRSLNFLNNHRIREKDILHNVEENLRLVGILGIDPQEPLPQLHVALNEADIKTASDWIKSNGISTDSLIVGFHAGSSLLKNHIRRRWAPEKFAQLGKRFYELHQATVLLFGGTEEFELNSYINNMMDGKGIIVTTSGLMTGIAIMKKCSVFVVNDSGLMHIAAGLQLPVVTIFAYTNPHYVHPWKTKYIMVRRDLECSPCFYYSPRPASCKWKEDQFRCITHIEVDEVYDAVMKILKDTSTVQH